MGSSESLPAVKFDCSYHTDVMDESIQQWHRAVAALASKTVAEHAMSAMTLDETTNLFQDITVIRMALLNKTASRSYMETLVGCLVEHDVVRRVLHLVRNHGNKMSQGVHLHMLELLFDAFYHGNKAQRVFMHLGLVDMVPTAILCMDHKSDLVVRSSTRLLSEIISTDSTKTFTLDACVENGMLASLGRVAMRNEFKTSDDLRDAWITCIGHLLTNARNQNAKPSEKHKEALVSLFAGIVQGLVETRQDSLRNALASVHSLMVMSKADTEFVLPLFGASVTSIVQSTLESKDLVARSSAWSVLTSASAIDDKSIIVMMTSVGIPRAACETLKFVASLTGETTGENKSQGWHIRDSVIFTLHNLISGQSTFRFRKQTMTEYLDAGVATLIFDFAAKTASIAAIGFAARVVTACRVDRLTNLLGEFLKVGLARALMAATVVVVDMTESKGDTKRDADAVKEALLGLTGLLNTNLVTEAQIKTDCADACSVLQSLEWESMGLLPELRNLVGKLKAYLV